ncbi:MAG: helix-turn-helix domain-containing protein [Nannocystaceae bacterium]
MIHSRWPKGAPAARRTVSVATIRSALRTASGVNPFRAAPGEVVAFLGRQSPEAIERLDVGAWIAWSLCGLELFAGALPSSKHAASECRRIVLALAMHRTGGNISETARIVGSSRKVLREHLRRLGLYDLERLP